MGAAACRRDAVFTTSPSDHRLALLGTSVEIDDHLAGVHREARLQVELLVGVVHLLQLVADRQRAPHGALGVVAVRDRRPEDAEHGVADELLDPAAVPLDLRPHLLEVRREEGAHVLRIELLRRER